MSSPGLPQDTLRGWLGASRFHIHGFAVDIANPGGFVRLILVIDGQECGRLIADREHDGPALLKLDCGTQHGFSFEYAPLDPSIPHRIAVQREEDGRHILNSPILLPAGFRFGDATLQELTRMFASVSEPPEILKSIRFLEEQMQVLRARHAENSNPRAERDALRALRTQHGPDFDAVIADRHAAVAVPRMLIVASAVPSPEHPTARLWRGHAACFRGLGWDISFAAAGAMDDWRQVEGFTEAEGFTGCAAPAYSTVEDVLKRQRGGFDAVYFGDIAVAVRYTQLVRAYQPRAFIALCVARLEHVMLGQIETLAGRRDRQGAVGRAQFLETTAARMANCILAGTPREARQLASTLKGANIRAIPVPIVLANSAPFAVRSGIGMRASWADDVDREAVAWLVNTVMPLVWRAVPDIRCHIAGPGWAEEVMPGMDPRIVFAAADVAAPMPGMFRLAVAPQRAAGAPPWDAMDSFAAGVPCVLSQVAAAGMPEHTGFGSSDVLRALIGQDAEGFARAIIRLHEDEDANRLAGAAGQALVADSLAVAKVQALLAAAVPMPR